MKKIFTAFAILCWCFIAAAQPVLYGVGGNRIYKFETATKTLTTAFAAPRAASNPFTLIRATDGKLYGLATGDDREGVLFSFDPATSTYTTIKDFTEFGGGAPEALIQATNGKLYIVAELDDLGMGVIYSFDLATSNFSKEKDFGGYPLSVLIQANNGKLYGMTHPDPLFAPNGVIFSFDPATSTFTVVKDFNKSDISTFSGVSLMKVSNGKLYGTTTGGGASGKGVMFSLDPATSIFTKLKDFDGVDGSQPNGLFQASNGKLYGTTRSGGINNAGVIFSFDPSTFVFKKLKDFSGVDGSVPFGLFQTANGKIYGMTYYGGIGGNGTIFSFDPATSTYTKLKDFNGVDGTNPFRLFQAGNGKLYGFTTSGGSSDNGVLFSFDPATCSYIKLKDFNANGVDGSTPTSLVQASNSKLYGLTGYGGIENKGILFSFDPATAVYKNEQDMAKTERAFSGPLVQANNGKMYGTDDNSIFSFDPATSSLTTLVHFTGPNGLSVRGSLVQATNGKLYGTTQEGGSNGYGVIFSFDPVTSTFEKEIDLVQVSHLRGDLVQAMDGKLYGVEGGTLTGFYIYSFDPVTSAYTVLHSISGSPVLKVISLVQATNGKLYGAFFDFDEPAAYLYSFDPATGVYSIVKRVDETGGSIPTGRLVQANNGKLYGTFDNVGRFDEGFIYSFDPATSVYDKLVDLAAYNGAPRPLSQLTLASNGMLYGSARTVIYSLDPVTSTFTKLANGDVEFTEYKKATPAVFYSKPTGDLNLLSTWGTNTNGTGTSPGDFGVGKTFYLANRGTVYTLTNDWSVGGVINIPAGSQLQLNGKTLSEAGVTGTGTITGSTTSNLVITGSGGGNAGTHYFTAGAGGMLNNLTLLRSGASASATIGSSVNIYGVFTVNSGTLNTGNFITLKSTASNTARVAPLSASADITGNVTVERYIPARKAWRLMSAPVAGTQTINAAWQEGVTTAAVNPNPYPGFGVQITGGTVANGFDQTGSSSIKKYNNSTDTWIPLTNTNATAVNSDAYMLFIAGDRTLNPANTTSPATSTILRSRGPLKTGNQTFPVSATGFTAVPNPFASPINFATITKNYVQNSFYVWDPKMAGPDGVGAWVNVSWNGSGYDVTPAAVSPESQYIQSGQGFMVHSTGMAGSIVIKETDKAGIPATNVFRSSNIAQGVRITLQSVEDNGSVALLDEVLTSYSPAFSDNLDNMDVMKLANIKENLGIVRSGNVLMVERRSAIRDNDTIELALTNTSAESYRFEINAANLSSSVVAASLEDMYQHTSTPVSLSGITRYDFAVNKDAASKNPYRFRLILGSKNIPTVGLESSIKAYPNPITNGNINITFRNQPKASYTVQLLSSQGSLVLSTTIQHEGGTATKAIQLSSNVAKGVYQLKVIATASSNTIKLIVDR